MTAQSSHDESRKNAEEKAKAESENLGGDGKGQKGQKEQKTAKSQKVDGLSKEASQEIALAKAKFQESLAAKSFNDGASASEIQTTFFELGLCAGTVYKYEAGMERFLERTAFAPEVEVANLPDIKSAFDFYLEGRTSSPELLLPPGKKNL